MKSNSLVLKNTYLGNAKIARKMRVRSIASSTAIETRESISSIKTKLTHSKHLARLGVTLA